MSDNESGIAQMSSVNQAVTQLANPSDSCESGKVADFS